MPGEEQLKGHLPLIVVDYEGKEQKFAPEQIIYSFIYSNINFLFFISYKINIFLLYILIIFILYFFFMTFFNFFIFIFSFNFMSSIRGDMISGVPLSLKISIFCQNQWGDNRRGGLVLSKLKKSAEIHLKTQVKNCVVIIPAHFREEQKNATIKACQQAGFNVLGTLNELEAAALAFGLEG